MSSVAHCCLGAPSTPTTPAARAGGFPIFSLYRNTPNMRFHEAKLRDDSEQFDASLTK